jgi:hypothetical protein
VKSIKSECLGQMIFLGRESLVRAITEYAAHYHEERSHQGIGNELISGVACRSEGSIEVRALRRLGVLVCRFSCSAPKLVSNIHCKLHGTQSFQFGRKFNSSPKQRFHKGSSNFLSGEPAHLG